MVNFVLFFCKNRSIDKTSMTPLKRLRVSEAVQKIYGRSGKERKGQIKSHLEFDRRHVEALRWSGGRYLLDLLRAKLSFLAIRLDTKTGEEPGNLQFPISAAEPVPWWLLSDI